jgi:predicted DNA-binding transcriptional regulator AlpA
MRATSTIVEPEYLTAQQVAQMTGFSLKSLEAMRHTRKGPRFFKVGTRVRYRVADVRAWIEHGGPVE